MMTTEEATPSTPPPPPFVDLTSSPREERLDLYDYDSLPCNNDATVSTADLPSSPAPLEPRRKRMYVVDDDEDDGVIEGGVTTEEATVTDETTPSPSVVDASFAESTSTDDTDVDVDVDVDAAEDSVTPGFEGHNENVVLDEATTRTTTTMTNLEQIDTTTAASPRGLDEVSLTGTSVSDLGGGISGDHQDKFSAHQHSPGSFDYSPTHYGNLHDSFSFATFQPPSLRDMGQQDASRSNRSTLYNILKAYEYRRKMSYDKQILSTSVYWSAVQAFLRKTVKETNVTEQTIRARILANRQYARHMTAMANCCEAIDDESNNTNTAQILGGETIISNGVTSHGTEEYLTLRSNGELLVRHRPKIEKNQDENDEEAVNKEPNISFNDLIMEENDRHQRIEEDVQLPQSTSNLYNGGELLGYLNEMAHSHRQVAKHFQENANKMTNDTLIEIVALRKQLSYVNYRAEALGKAVVLELRTAEHMVRDAWNAYAEIVELYENSKLGEPDDQPNQWNDMWLHEARYRVAVGLLSSCWNKCSATLSKLFNKVKDVEVERRICLRELMIQLMQRQEVEWMGLSSTGAGVLVNLASTSIEPAVIHQGLHDAIRREAKKNAQKERERILQERAQNDRDADSSQRSINNLRISSSSIPELLENKISSDDLDNDHIVPARKDEIMMEISSPLSSELLGAAQVLRRKRCSGIFKSWRSTLAITTADQYLHFFDVNCNSSSNQWKTAEMTFNELMPDVETPSEETVNISANPRKAPSRRWHKLIEPTESLFLPRCEAGIYYDESTRMHIVEIKEKKPTTGRRAFFGKKNTVKKMFIQAEHEDNLSYWADGLEQMGVKMKK